MRKCRNCHGKGTVEGRNLKGVCYYCNGKGIRNKSYGRDTQ